MKPVIVSSMLAWLAAGCGSSVSPPSDQWAAAQGDVGRAQAAGAPATPDAKLHLRLAQEDLQRARSLVGSDNKRATSLTELARAEAQLALSLAKESASQASARDAQSQVWNAQQGK